MGEKTHIAWTDSTFNPWIGCTKVSPGCAHCYAEVSTRARVLRSQGLETWGKGKPRSRTKTWKEPLLWTRFFVCQSCGSLNVTLNKSCNAPHPERGFCDGALRRQRVFCASLCDWLDDEVPIEWLADLLTLIGQCGNLDWQLLTKRPQNWRKRMTDALDVISKRSPTGHDWIDMWVHDDQPPDHIWVGATAENQDEADRRAPELLKIPAKVRFLSCEPLLGPVDISRYLSLIDRAACDLEDDPLAACLLQQGIDSGHADARRMIEWVIIGGESGPKARPCHLPWIDSLVQQCKRAGVAPFVKQVGADPFVNWPYAGDDGAAGLVRAKNLGYLHASCLPGEPKPFKDKKGGDMEEWPADLRVREFPKTTAYAR